MVIYDKHQFGFNIVLILLLISSILMNIIYANNFRILTDHYMTIEERLTQIESNQDFNFIQSTHHDIPFQLTPTGFFINGVNDFGVLDGSSMQPVIFDNNTMLQVQYDGHELEEGEIVRFLRDDGTAVVHRIRADYGDTVYVQGDALKVGEIIQKNKITHIVVGVLYT